MIFVALAILIIYAVRSPSLSGDSAKVLANERLSRRLMAPQEPRNPSRWPQATEVRQLSMTSRWKKDRNDSRSIMDVAL
ncbi:unnamed protein product [Callosobruchus maculatus]|uniref:Uncharacterized protein n=1 Tax=Callosobruchus maculatus TaxID=64391 RepID=A0A653BTW3_CALMS|nr:unnamed protein product [Callosobruchus maculatus]